jgi:hypothetical protein
VSVVYGNEGGDYLKLDRQTWTQTLRLSDEIRRRGENFTWRSIHEALEVTHSKARLLHSAVINKDIIRCEPEAIEVRAMDRELFICDIHIPFQDDSAVGAALSFADDFKPTRIVLGGDLFDFYKISRFVKNPTKPNISTEIGRGKVWLTMLRNRYPDAEIIMYEGNHEMHMDRYIMETAPQLFELTRGLLQGESGLHLEALNIKYITEPFRIGKLWHLHGHEKPGGAYNPEYVCNVMWQYVHDHFLVAHFHRTQEKHFGRIDGKKFYTASVGYLVGVMEYARLNKWNQGFQTITYNADGTFKPSSYSIVNGEVY